MAKLLTIPLVCVIPWAIGVLFGLTPENWKKNCHLPFWIWGVTLSPPWDHFSSIVIQDIIMKLETRSNNPLWMPSYKCTYSRRKHQVQANSYSNAHKICRNPSCKFIFSKLKIFLIMDNEEIMWIFKTHDAQLVNNEDLNTSNLSREIGKEMMITGHHIVLSLPLVAPSLTNL